MLNGRDFLDDHSTSGCTRLVIDQCQASDSPGEMHMTAVIECRRYGPLLPTRVRVTMTMMMMMSSHVSLNCKLTQRVIANCSVMTCLETSKCRGILQLLVNCQRIDQKLGWGNLDRENCLASSFTYVFHTIKYSLVFLFGRLCFLLL